MAVTTAGLMFEALIPANAYAQTAVYSFTGGADGGQPIGGVVQDSTGTLYGETYVGGSTNCTSKALSVTYGCGTVYSVSPSGTLRVLVTFQGANGAHGSNTLTLVGSTLYGTATNGGTSDDGVVFAINTDGTAFTLLHQFSGSDGEYPAGTLQVGKGGLLLGMTTKGGAHNDGVLFSITKSGIYSTLHTFAGGNDGSHPQTLVASTTGTLVGSTSLGGGVKSVVCQSGCGTDFEYVPSTGAYSIIYVFNYSNGVGGAVGSIGPGPTLYGNDFQAPYALSAKNGLVNSSAFGFYAIGTVATGPLLTPNGTLYGVNGVGENAAGGTLYSAANGVTTGLSSFGGALGYNPLAQPILTPSGNLIGTTSEGGLCSSCGVVWQFTPP